MEVKGSVARTKRVAIDEVAEARPQPGRAAEAERHWSGLAVRVTSLALILIACPKS